MKKTKITESVLAVLFLVAFSFALAMSFNIRKAEDVPRGSAKDIAHTIKVTDYGTGLENKVVSNSETIDAIEYEYDSYRIKNGATVKVADSVIGVTIRAKKEIVIEAGGAIDGSAVNTTLNISNGTYGSHSGVSGLNGCEAVPDGRGGFGGSADFSAGEMGFYPKGGSPGSGGGYIRLIAPRIVIDGELRVNGGNGMNGGGGAGGKVVVISPSFVFQGKITARGGNGSSGNLAGFGGGGGGWIIVPKNNYNSADFKLEGGSGGSALDIYTGCNGSNGNSGEILFLVFGT